MFLVNTLIAALAFVGRHGTLAVALSIFIGLLLPSFAAAFKPLLGETIVVLLTLAFLRVSPAALGALARRPVLVLAAAAWVMLALPVALAALFTVAGIKAALPDLYFILILQSCAPALMSSPALAGLMGLDVALTLATLVLSTAIVPFAAGAFMHVFLGTRLIGPFDFGLRLFLLIAGSAALATVIRRIASNERVEAQRELVDGLSVVGMFIFAMAAMDGVAAHTLADPGLVAALTALSFALALGVMALTTLVFLPAGRHRAFAIGILASNRNLGVMLAATGFMVPDLAWLYFGVAQFPIYLLPMLLKPLARRLEQADISASST